MAIELNHALIIYVIIVIILVIIFIRLRIHTISALILGLFLGMIVLDIMFPPSNLNNLTGSSASEVSIYIVIQIITLFMVIIYTFITAWKDKKKDVNFSVKI